MAGCPAVGHRYHQLRTSMIGRVMRGPFARLDPGVSLLIVAAAFGVLTTILTLAYLQGAERSADSGMALVAITKGEVKSGETISAENIELVTVPRASLQAGALLTAQEAAGRVARLAIAGGD